MQRLQVLKESFFAMDVFQQRLMVGTAVAAGVILAYILRNKKQVKRIPFGDGWWRAGEKQLEDEKIYPFKVQTSDEEIKDLHDRIDRMRYTSPLQDSGFQYGINFSLLKKAVSHWRHQFDWKKQVAVLNKYPHFKTTIEGLDIHFIHVKPPHRENQRVLPIMFVHGWPGSFYEFYKIIPLLTENHEGIAFEIICPSIPGYGFSDAPQTQGFDTIAAARIFLKLMERLGFSKFYLQGGDWGSMITANMAQMKPECVKGLHLNMFQTNQGLKALLTIMFGRYFPSLLGLSKEDVRRLYPFFEKSVWVMIKETGYLHIQATKPDTAGCGLNDSPVGLAAYILEKFYAWADLKDEELERKFSLDDVLTNIMIYWTTGSIVPSMRFYKENLPPNKNRIDSRTPIFVPTGLAAFPGEIMHAPKCLAQSRYHNICTYTFMPRGGHFAAFEEPQLLSSDVVQFVKKVEKL